MISAGGVLDLCYADEEALGGGAGAVARFLGHRGGKMTWWQETRFFQAILMRMSFGWESWNGSRNV